MGVVHGDELQYVFQGLYGDEYAMSTADRKFSKNIFTPLLTNFAKTSVPTPSLTESITVAWTPVEPNKNHIYRISDKPSMDTEHKQDTLKFWYETIPNLFKKKPKAVKKDEL